MGPFVTPINLKVVVMIAALTLLVFTSQVLSAPTVFITGRGTPICLRATTSHLKGKLGEDLNPHMMAIFNPNLPTTPPGVDTTNGAMHGVIKLDIPRNDSFVVVPPFDAETGDSSGDSGAATAATGVPDFSGDVQERQAKKEAESLPWSCPTDSEWRDLGPNIFPRYLRYTRCGKSSCFYGHYSCIAQTYAVKVLRKINSECTGVRDTHGEYIMIERWLPYKIRVPMNCACQSGL